MTPIHVTERDPRDPPARPITERDRRGGEERPQAFRPPKAGSFSSPKVGTKWDILDRFLDTERSTVTIREPQRAEPSTTEGELRGVTDIQHEGRLVLTPAAKRWLTVALLLIVVAWLTWRGLNPVHGAHPPLTSIP